MAIALASITVASAWRRASITGAKLAARSSWLYTGYSSGRRWLAVKVQNSPARATSSRYSSRVQRAHAGQVTGEGLGAVDQLQQQEVGDFRGAPALEATTRPARASPRWWSRPSSSLAKDARAARRQCRVPAAGSPRPGSGPGPRASRTRATPTAAYSPRPSRSVSRRNAWLPRATGARLSKAALSSRTSCTWLT